MRQARLKADARAKLAYYHCISRVVGREFLLGEAEKEQFVAFLREYERFCGVRVLTYCVMSNHFHVLVEVPRRPEKPLTDEELVARLYGLSGLSEAATIEQRLGWLRERGQHGAAEVLRERVMARMWDVSGFMKLLKQRYTQWYNRLHDRTGTLWEARFKSVLVEGAGHPLATMAAYIDLNPVRAKLVLDPKDYRWCGYAAAVAGEAGAVEGLGRVLASVEGHRKAGAEALRRYRCWLYGQGAEREGVTEAGEPLMPGLSAEAVAEVIEAKGRLPLNEYLRLRVRYFTDGVVLGTRGFVNEVFQTFRDRFGPKRKDGARRLRYLKGTELFSLRDLQTRIVGHDGG